MRAAPAPLVRLAGAMLILAAAGLAGLGGARGWAAGSFGFLAVAVLMLERGERWVTPPHLAGAAILAMALPLLLFALGRWTAGRMTAPPAWGLLPPLALAAAGAALTRFGLGRDARR
ncbi:hypothetical protein [uncultured Paracoccus sp.]|uniref:hypothetical protein n=1 Tax=uncultured Paracoccus sp. TaxID=189685 RepID=UPI00260D18CF|nr:hypothetical protein [uncultured Paracoccus sp.]